MSTKPKLIVTSQDAERLEILLDSLSPTAFPAKATLEDELDRAVRVDPRAVPPTVVTMNSTVRFDLLPAGGSRCLKLVYPGSPDAGEETISILAPVGSALLGLSEGDVMDWPRPGGGTLRLVIREVVDQPERSGNYEL
ncbi:MAG: nucleoside diphosphate kinase regulator [Deltaproteobacteria bacterium]|nr:nucleoside diphosphate kinase regulator [Deltaproteobacteria bacterium]